MSRIIEEQIPITEDMIVKPRGRLIDADALLKILEREKEYHENNGLPTRADGITDAIMDVIDAPTIEPERETGKWGEHGECPFCGYLQQWDDDKFCGNCGARMEGGESC